MYIQCLEKRRGRFGIGFAVEGRRAVEATLHGKEPSLDPTVFACPRQIGAQVVHGVVDAREQLIGIHLSEARGVPPHDFIDPQAACDLDRPDGANDRAHLAPGKVAARECISSRRHITENRSSVDQHARITTGAARAQNQQHLGRQTSRCFDIDPADDRKRPYGFRQIRYENFYG